MVPTSVGQDRPTEALPSPAGLSEVDVRALASLAAGDRDDALTRLMQAYGPELHRFCYSMLGDAALADDVHQSVFVQAYEALGGFRSQGSLRAWLFGIARHRCLDASKARRRFHWRFFLAPDAGSDAADPAPVSVEQTSETDATTDRRATALRGCLRALAPHVRVAILLRFEQGLGYEEIARMSQERAGTVQARVARALPLLRDCVAAKEATP